MTSVKEWKSTIAPKILKDIGFSLGQIIIDFGCGTGIYDLILSEIIGPKGKIFAIDSNEGGLLNQLIDDIEQYQIKNVEVIETSGEINIPVEDHKADFLVIYDIMHLIEEDERKLLIKEASRVLRRKGKISYHATHIDGENDDFVLNIHELMKEQGFSLIETYKKPMFHWSWIQDSWIFNYQRFK